MQKPISPRIVALTFGVLVLSFLAVFYAVAWQEPTLAPPQGNVDTPLNVGAIGQSKKGNLILNTDNALANGLIVAFGNVGIGTLTPGGYDASDRVLEITSAGRPNLKLHVPGVTEYKIAIEDLNNNLYIVHTDNNGLPRNGKGIVIDSNGNVGIGTTAGPSQKLDVNGNVKATSFINIGGLAFPGPATPPACDPSQRGQQWLKWGSSAEDGLYICKKKANGDYEWIALASPPAIGDVLGYCTVMEITSGFELAGSAQGPCYCYCNGPCDNKVVNPACPAERVCQNCVTIHKNCSAKSPASCNKVQFSDAYEGLGTTWDGGCTTARVCAGSSIGPTYTCGCPQGSKPKEISRTQVNPGGFCGSSQWSVVYVCEKI